MIVETRINGTASMALNYMHIATHTLVDAQ